MKNLMIIAIIIIIATGCTYGKFNSKTKDFTFASTKEYDYFQIKYRKVADTCYTTPNVEVTVTAKKVKAFEGQKIVADTVKDGIKASIKPF